MQTCIYGLIKSLLPRLGKHNLHPVVLKGNGLEWFKLDLLDSTNPNDRPCEATLGQRTLEPHMLSL